ncbi:MAG: hypothetical protein IKA76_09005 [Clostridia bacterium]|nr:hypothetical protein [Clostridia bacterium]
MKDQAIKKLTEALDSVDLTEYRSIPFWSWNNELSEDELCRQIEDMKEAGIGGFIMHARTGLKTEYLGEKWFSCIEACLKKARDLHMRAWVYDENGWPSGFVGGKLLEDESMRARFLTYEVKDFYDEAAFAVYERKENGFVRLSAPKEGMTEYHCVYLKVSPANTDILDPRVVDAFIKETHEEYYRRFPESFGRELCGFFTDEPQYYRWATPYTPVAAPIYLERYGEDIREGLIYLFTHDKVGFPFRQRYFKLLNELYTNNFYKRLYDWCTDHNCMLTGHSIEEKSLSSQMWGGAGVMPSYEYEHIPAIDCLGRECQSELPPKQVGSVVSQLGGKQILTETFACCGFDVTPKELKSVAEFQYFNGVNLMCQHLYPYSFSNQAKYDYPPVFSKHGNWFEGFRVFNDYFTRLGFLVANTEEVADVLIVHPMRDVYLDYVHAEGIESCAHIDQDFSDLLMELRRRGICFQLADESILARYGKNEKGALRIGKRSYNKVILPKMRSISKETLELLKGFDGFLCVTDRPSMIDGEPAEVSILGNISLDEIQTEAYVSFGSDGHCGITARTGEIGEYLFIKNYSRTECGKVWMKGVAERYSRLDLETMTTSPIANVMTLEPCGGIVLIRDEDAKEVVTGEQRCDITKDFAVDSITENSLTLDYASVSFDGTHYESEAPIPAIFEDLLRKDYKGTLFVKYTFRTEAILPIYAWIECENYTSVTLNGIPVALNESGFDVNLARVDLKEAMKIGENELILSMNYWQHDGVHFALFDPMATESLRNCLYYDTYIGSVYLFGDFVVSKDRIIRQREGLPSLSSDLYRQGYPFFKGELTVKGTYCYDGKGRRMLSLEKGRFLVAELVVNGVSVPMVMDRKKEITEQLRAGENHIKIRLRSSLRNLFGPHHWKADVDPIYTSPRQFSMRGTWKDGQSDAYTHEYHFVPFGIDAVEMIEIQE